MGKVRGLLTLVGVLAAGMLLGAARPARAAPPTGEPGKADVELRYTRPTGTAGLPSCADEGALHDAVRQRLGYDPFRAAPAARVLVVALTKTDHGLRARIDRLDARGQVVGTRTLDSPTADCSELSASVALAVSLAIDPLRASAPPLASPPPTASLSISTGPPAGSGSEGTGRGLAGTPPAARSDNASPEADVASPPSAPLRAMLSASILASSGTAPALAVGASGELRLRKGAASLGLGVRGDAPAGATASGDSGGRVQTSLLAGTAVPCVHVGMLAACASALVGSLAGSASHLAHAEPQRTLFSALGGRVLLTPPLPLPLPVADLLSLGAYVEVLAALTPTTLRIDSQAVWSTSPVSGVLGLQATLHFP